MLVVADADLEHVLERAMVGPASKRKFEAGTVATVAYARKSRTEKLVRRKALECETKAQLAEMKATAAALLSADAGFFCVRNSIAATALLTRTWLARLCASMHFPRVGGAMMEQSSAKIRRQLS